MQPMATLAVLLELWGAFACYVLPWKSLSDQRESPVDPGCPAMHSSLLFGAVRRRTSQTKKHDPDVRATRSIESPVFFCQYDVWHILAASCSNSSTSSLCKTSLPIPPSSYTGHWFFRVFPIASITSLAVSLSLPYCFFLLVLFLTCFHSLFAVVCRCSLYRCR